MGQRRNPEPTAMKYGCVCSHLIIKKRVCQTSTDSCSAKFLLSEASRHVLHTKLRFEYFGNCFMVLFI